jgi:hypothetical protein
MDLAVLVHRFPSRRRSRVREGCHGRYKESERTRTVLIAVAITEG